MDKVLKKRRYIDKRFRTVDSIPDSDIKFDLQEQFDSPDNSFVTSTVSRSLTHGEQLNLITTNFI